MPPVVRAQLNYYAVLEITPAADVTEVNAAFRRLAWRYHPDRNPAPGATLQFQDINEAHQVLSDSARRAEYDAKWHPKGIKDQRPRYPQTRHHSHRRWHRRRNLRNVLLTVFALLFVSSAWTVIFTAMTVAHSAGPSYSYIPSSDSSSMVGSASSCAYSMEIVPITYVNARGHSVTLWETDMRNCYGGATRISAAGPFRAARFANDPEVR